MFGIFDFAALSIGALCVAWADWLDLMFSQLKKFIGRGEFFLFRQICPYLDIGSWLTP